MMEYPSNFALTVGIETTSNAANWRGELMVSVSNLHMCCASLLYQGISRNNVGLGNTFDKYQSGIETNLVLILYIV